MTAIRMAYYDETVEVEIPERNLIDVLVPTEVPKCADLAGRLEWNLDNPIGTPSFSKLCAGRKKVCILVCDLTRPMQTDKILPTVIKRIEEQSPGAEITILVALGTHRPLSREEIARVVGKQIQERYKVVNHDARDEGCLATVPGSRDDFPIAVNRLLLDCDFRMGIGAVKPHPIFGWSGGAKIVIPGVSGYATTGLSHWNSCPYQGTDIMGRVDNPVRLEAEEIVSRNRLLDFIVNAILDGNSEISDLRCGDPVLAHRACVEKAETYYSRDIARPADAVVAGVGHWGADLWVGSMSVFQSEFFLKRGGTIVLLGKFPEGVSKTHPEILEWGYRPYREVRELVHQGKLSKDLTLAAHLVHLGRVLDSRQARCAIISEGISRGDAAKLGFEYLDSPGTIFEYLAERHGRDAGVLAIPGFNSTPIISRQPVAI